MLAVEDVAVVLRAALRAGASWAELFIEHRDSETVRLDGGQVSEIRSDRDVGAAVRVVSGGLVGLAYTNVISVAKLVEAAEAAAVVSGGAAVDARTVNLRRRAVIHPQVSRVPAASVDAAEKVALLRRADDAARAHDRAVRDVTAIHVDVAQQIMVATTTGLLVQDERVRTRLTCRVSASRDGRTDTGFDGPGIGGGFELYDDPPEGIAVRAAQRAMRALEGSEPPGGQMTVVLGPGGGGLLLHEACGHGLEADGLSRESSVYAPSAGRQIASPLVTAYDDPSLPGAFGSYGCDDEGLATSPTLLIDRGHQVGAMTDLVTAAAVHASASANGRRASYADPPLPRMSNTYIAAGTDDPSAVLADVRSGVYVSRLRGGDVNISTGEFAFAAAEAWLIEGGRLTRPLSGVTLLGNGPAALSAIDAVCGDLDFTQAMCAKEDQWVPVSYGAPTLRITGLTVAGSD